MATLGQFNTLRVTRRKDFGVYLNAGELGEVLLPRSQCPTDLEIGESIRVFLYLDSDDYLIATTARPHACVGDFAMLRVAEVNDTGAFMDWGLSKQLLVPYSEQKPRPLTVGKRYLVHLYIDAASERIVGSTRIDRFLDKTPADYKAGDAVDLVVANRTELGQKAIINQQHWGMVFQSDLLQPLYPGQRIQGYIKEVREDGKITLSLQKPGYGRVIDTTEKILEMLSEQDGFLPVHDKSSPDTIFQLFGISKKAFKMAVGALLKQGKIELCAGGIRLTR
ncbi:S1-like domain-containing RNA-binding protein [Neptuniibacter sp. CAU 1671]|uniref:CvfB family protein n=1 Tax=Neptuniibacter sp. CAU 1671 TaxID=3032593 RepID=UPI0023DC16D8|nr:S1-like domain-containing RNA-binding protein [Neptuniibacter sp. CAU 1671]MDF2181834.1 S1-like domain-containing RNA-binding protein [Neptuniibacter sp. CAU 1671]